MSQQLTEPVPDMNGQLLEPVLIWPEWTNSYRSRKLDLREIVIRLANNRSISPWVVTLEAVKEDVERKVSGMLAALQHRAWIAWRARDREIEARLEEPAEADTDLDEDELKREAKEEVLFYVGRLSRQTRVWADRFVAEATLVFVEDRLGNIILMDESLVLQLFDGGN